MSLKIISILLFLAGFCNLLLSQSRINTNELENYLDSIYSEYPESNGIIVAIIDSSTYYYSAVNNDKIPSKHVPKNSICLIASMTKTYVSASILKLYEQGKININKPIDLYLTDKTKNILSEAGYNIQHIYVKDLLKHTSGIYDYVDSIYFDFVRDNPSYRWSRDEQINRATLKKADSITNKKLFNYADVNYLLLTEIIENITEMPFNIAMNELLKFEELNLNNTFFYTLDAYPNKAEPIAEQISPKHNIESKNLDPSWDLYGGGGIASTAEESSRFIYSLFQNKIIKDEHILQQMIEIESTQNNNYAFGIRVIKLPKATLYYHGGYWGTDFFYCPEYGVAVSVFVLNKSFQNILNPEIGMKIIDFLERGSE